MVFAEGGSTPRRGDIRDFEPDPTKGREQRGRRPCVVISADWFNDYGSGLVTVVPCTTRDRGLRTHVVVSSEDSGLPHTTVVMCDQVRAISLERLSGRRGQLSAEALRRVEYAVRAVLDL